MEHQSAIRIKEIIKELQTEQIHINTALNEANNKLNEINRHKTSLYDKYSSDLESIYTNNRCGNIDKGENRPIIARETVQLISAMRDISLNNKHLNAEKIKVIKKEINDLTYKLNECEELLKNFLTIADKEQIKL